MPINSVAEVFGVFDKLWSKGATSFLLELQRDGRSLTSSYRVVKP